MSTSQSPLSIVLLLFCLPLLGALTAGLLGLSFPAGLLPVALTAGVGAWLGTRFRASALADSRHTAHSQPADSRQNASITPVAVPASPSAPRTPTLPSQPSDTQAQPAPVVDTIPAPAPAAADADPKLRHDIRNILSPAMLAAEQLGTSTDPLVLRAVRTIDESLDRALLRLKQKPQS
ncbi:hypothetical protein JK169_06520 [Acetobacter persici]|uniref:hypothetical protein n=1 Tax=Acetobacter persici TaxID=1076596 RepID=UPI001BA78849|nr:hypothetical protein [Acetobacter persici]MBS1000678.1 hypothetical protein [Acetobacter persici]